LSHSSLSNTRADRYGYLSALLLAIGRSAHRGVSCRAAGNTEMMNPLLFADWSRIQRLFHRTMWLLATVLACIVWSALALRASGAPAHSKSRSSLTHLTLRR
jgi:hypothetical protein